MYLTDLRVVRPTYEKSQESLLEWILKAHMHAKKSEASPEEDLSSFEEQLKEKLFKIGFGEKKIQSRGFMLDDFNHFDWDQMKLFNLNEKPEGHHLDKRMGVFHDAALSLMHKLYPEGETLPPQMIHVTCTGYVSPSALQCLIDQKKASYTNATHAYHMGCFGALKGTEQAMGFCARENNRTDVVHTELCSLHFNPTMHSTEQLVVQSLFADGVIRYSVDANCPDRGFEILSTQEILMPDTTDKMTWNTNHWGFEMTIAKEVPVLIRRCVDEFLEKLGHKAGISKEELQQKAHFAIHPGGPKIIDQVAEKLKLEQWQITHSLDVLKNYGNMSSATLPHVWEALARDEKCKSGDYIVSMAFGPGLTIAGNLMRKL